MPVSAAEQRGQTRSCSNVPITPTKGRSTPHHVGSPVASWQGRNGSNARVTPLIYVHHLPNVEFNRGPEWLTVVPCNFRGRVFAAGSMSGTGSVLLAPTKRSFDEGVS
jgi:hypothetical protein